jgi:isopenicillin N synthase-like dioxygenase
MPKRFQPTGEELKLKYADMFRVDTSEIEEILKGELEFIEKLGMSVELPEKDKKEPEPLPGKDSAFELKELRKAIKKFLEKDERWE